MQNTILSQRCLQRLAEPTVGVLARVLLGMIFFLVPASAVHAATFISVFTRIETPAETLFAAEIYLSDEGCVVTDAAGAEHQITGAKAICALAMTGVDYSVVDSSFGLYLDGIGQYAGDAANYWLFYVNDQSAMVGLADYELTSGDELLLTYGGWPNAPLKLTLGKRQIKVGKAVRALVETWDETVGAYKPVSGAPVYFGSQIITTDEQGVAIFTPTESGQIIIYAAVEGYTNTTKEQLRVFKQFAKVRQMSRQAQRALTTSGVDYLRAQINERGMISDSQSMTEWSAMALVAAGDEVKGKIRSAVVAYEPTVESGTTEIARHILALEALGKDARHAKGVNYVKRLKATRLNGQFGATEYVNDDIFAALALLAANEPMDARALRQAVKASLAGVNADGGVSYAVAAEISDVDTTAAFLQVLGYLKNHKKFDLPRQKQVRLAAARYLREQQNLDGGWGYSAHETSNASSTAWALQALQALGRDAKNITTNNRNGYNFLKSLRTAAGAFSYNTEGAPSAVVLNTAYAIMAINRKPLPVI